MIRAAFLCLLIGFTIGGLILSAKGGIVAARVWIWLPVHVILLVNGWMLQLSLGVAYWIAPRIRLAERGRRPFAWAGFTAFSLGNMLLIVSLARLWWTDFAKLTAPSVILQMLGVSFFVFHLLPRIRPAMIRANQRHSTTPRPFQRMYRVNDVAPPQSTTRTEPLPMMVLSTVIILVTLAGLSILGNAIEDEAIHDARETVATVMSVENHGGQAGSVVEESPPSPIRVIIIGSEYHFEPDTLEFKVGVPVELVFENRGTTEHDFVIADMPIAGRDEAGIHLYAWFGDSATVTFTPTTAGEYEIICSIVGHKEAGMTGRAIVTE
jgi:uncharacterized cupredoxin-like copper-binding protein